ncbi:MAG: NADPH:quinone oxidoreductase family protein [Gammaproteobacteria bacterium]
MKAILCREWGPPEQLELSEHELPAPAAGEVRIAVHACGVNFADALIVQGKYQERPSFPFSPGMEAAGCVLECGEGVGGLVPGDRVVALCGHGGFAEEFNSPAAAVRKIPDSMSYTIAAGFSVTYGTSHVALQHRAALQAGETLLVHGAAGGVGLTAVEIGKLMGATVIATASTEDKLALAKSYGADHAIDYTRGGFKDQVKALTGGAGADVIFDPVGGPVFDESLRCINWEGRLVVIGFASGTIAELPTNLALVKNFAVLGLYWGGYQKRKPAVLQASWERLLEWFEQGRLEPHVSRTFPLDDAPRALSEVLRRNALGKLVIAVRDG